MWQVGDRCIVKPGARRGAVAFVGKIPSLKTGYWVRRTTGCGGWSGLDSFVCWAVPRRQCADRADVFCDGCCVVVRCFWCCVLAVVADWRAIR